MPESFHDLLGRARRGDAEASAALVKQYEPAIRRSLRLRLDPRLRRVCDSADICQAVMASFFVRAATGQYEIDTPEQMLRLLTTMARNKLFKTRRDQQRARRDHRREVGGEALEQGVAGNDATPSRIAAAREMLDEVRHRLTEEERRLVELRGQGHDWAAIAAELGGSAEALRKKLARAVTRVEQELDPDGAGDE